MRAIAVGDKVMLVMTEAEVAYIKARLECSSFKTYDTYRQEVGAPHPVRKHFSAAFNTALEDIISL
jgi:hypothetical protein